MGVDITRGRRGYNYKCTYWKRKLNGVYDNEELIMRNNPSGTFYAKIVSERTNSSMDIGGVFHDYNDSISIETECKVNIQKDDIVKFNGTKWLVELVRVMPIQKNAEFSRNTSNRTTIVLQRG